MRVLAMGCHPDDIEVACAGTLAACKARGDDVFVCHVANGNMGHAIIEPGELREMRAGEFKRSAAMLGAEPLTCDIGDVVVYADDRAQRDAVIDVLRYVKPDVIITHSPDDYMPDHVAVSKLVFDASFVCTIPHYKTKQPHYGSLVPIYYMDTLAGLSFQPTEYVDISEHIELKLDMLNCHESQIKWMIDHDNIDFIDFVRTCAKYRGLQCGVPYAEAFSQCLRWPKVLPRRMLP